MKSDKIATPEQPMPVFRFYLNAMVVFFVLRLLFLFYHLSLFENSSMTDIVWAFLCGFMIDSSVTTTVLFFLSLFAIPIEFISRKAATKFYICSVHVCLGFCFFVNLADIAYFEIYDSRLNILVWENIGQMGPILQTILVEFHLYVALLALAGLMAGFAWLNRHTVRFFRCRWCQKHRAISTACSLVALVGLSFLWIGEPFWRMSAFASGNQALNQLSLNGVYTLTKALDQKRILDNDSGGVNYQFGSLDSALDRTRATIVSDSEEAVSDLYPLARKQISPVALSVAKPNIVIIIMERLTANNVGVLLWP